MSTNKQKFNKRYGFKLNEPHSKQEISKITGVSMGILDQVYDRGLGARKSNPQSVRSLSGKKVGGGSLKGKMSGPQWAMARVYSFVVGGKTQKTADKDLWAKHLLKEHKQHHTSKHMTMMRKLIKEGDSFDTAHKKAMKSVGK